MTEPSVDYEVALREDLEDPEEAAAYLNAALEDGSREAFLMALRDVADSRGLAQPARDAALDRGNC